jgi:hypothetical protein
MAKKKGQKGKPPEKKKRLKKTDRNFVIKCVAEGLLTDEINARAARRKNPFQVSRQTVDYYRKTRKHALGVISKLSESKAMVEGYALVETRVHKLGMLAALLEADLFGGALWLEDAKGIGSGDVADIFEFESFNDAEVKQYRALLDDIARETGGRSQRTTALNFDLNLLPTEYLRRIADGEDALEVFAEFLRSKNE